MTIISSLLPKGITLITRKIFCKMLISKVNFFSFNFFPIFNISKDLVYFYNNYYKRKPKIKKNLKRILNGIFLKNKKNNKAPLIFLIISFFVFYFEIHIMSRLEKAFSMTAK